MKDVRIGLSDRSHIHLAEAEVRHVPNVSHPEFVDIKSRLVNLRLPYYSVDYIYPEWSNADLTGKQKPGKESSNV
jgi:hypothetical protein